MFILGISAWYHDAAASLLHDGQLVAAAEEERFTRVKHDARFPAHAVEYCLREAGIGPDQIDYVGFYEKPWRRFGRLAATHVDYAPSGFASFAATVPPWLREKLGIGGRLRRALGGHNKVVFTEHHEAHAASAFLPSPYRSSAILVVDGVGEWATATFGVGQDNTVDLYEELRFPHSLGLLYSAFTYYLGFRVNSGEYKIMGLAPYGEPRYVQTILDQVLDLRDDGSFRLDMRFFDYCNGLTMTAPAFDRLFGGKPRRPDEPITTRHMDVARSIQDVTNECVLRMGRYVHRRTGQQHLCLAGGVALNCVANAALLREGPFEHIWIQPAAGDAGGAVGAAFSVWHQYLGKNRCGCAEDRMRGAFLGPEYSESAIECFLAAHGIPHSRVAPDALVDHVANRLAAGEVVGWFQGRMEFGPRALGNRSILGDPRSPTMQARMNAKIKFRESFRPFAPAVLESRVQDYFDLACPSPYMLLTAPVHPDQRVAVDEHRVQGFDRMNVMRSRIPAVTHVDGSARVQTVARADNPRFYALLERFGAMTGVPVLVNTSFNLRGEPIVCSPEDAYRCFCRSGIDCLVLGEHVIDRAHLPGVSDDQGPAALD